MPFTHAVRRVYFSTLPLVSALLLGSAALASAQDTPWKPFPEVTRGSETFLVAKNESTYIPLGEVHRLRNPGRTMLEIIEVQSGTYLGEDDIERFDDEYGRTS